MGGGFFVHIPSEPALSVSWNPNCKSGILGGSPWWEKGRHRGAIPQASIPSLSKEHGSGKMRYISVVG